MDIYQHFRKEEEPFIDQILSWKEQVEQTFISRLTDFLDPREQHIMETLIGTTNDELKLHMYGGNPYGERKRVLLSPYYEEVSEDAFQLSLLQASYHEKFIRLEHRDVMGAFLSLGMKRKKLGDIYVGNGIIQIIIAKEIASYVISNLTSIKKANIQFEEINLSLFQAEEAKWLESDSTVSSLRLDTVMKEIYHISRNDAQECIKKQYVKVNFKIVEDKTFKLQEGDMISLRGKGRSRLVTINGQTKKEKWKITTALMK
ncbi:RNA-binding protein [Oceanobacillus bengalensis]|uniref:RNA-binding protein n=1 Tax=Oceanobacillus bengalensis TaxID=1435466 RepID=A0A494Z1M6_9BACI|nr:YlmH/Sll1252 family protein [Oceanobacillus bengalensis]RKQ16293.1 RNA-binding protein [Oceanobacillus bengalensis]